MPRVNFGRKNEPGFDLEASDDLIVVRTRSGRPLTARGPVPSPIEAGVDDGTLVVSYPEAGVEVYQVPVKGGGRSLEARKKALRGHPDVRFAGGVLVDPATREPVLYTENLFVKFKDTLDPEECERILAAEGLAIKQRLAYAVNAYFVQPPEGTGQRVFDIANKILSRDDVEYCHPELIRPRARKAIFPEQWHLKPATVGGMQIAAHANVEAAHLVAMGEGVTVAVIDDGFDVGHPEFVAADKVVAPRDATLASDDPRPKDPDPRFPDDHGTACAGVACASGAAGASGVAPKARLMPIRLVSGLGSLQEAAAFTWAADHGADVISCSWGPPDGRWFHPGDPRHNQVVPLPASTKLAIDAVTRNGRGGKGCVVLFAAGNGNESVDNDGYASYERVIAVAACNDRGTRSVYSDFGRAVWCAFPSSDFGHPPFDHPDALTPGIWTTDRRSGQGYNPGSPADGDGAGDFTNSFGGTSSACPGAAGVAALVISVNPGLTAAEVREVLKQACDRIDPQNGAYDPGGHSRLYGFGRLNAARAVELARPQPASVLTISRQVDAPLPDLQTVELTLTVAESAVAQSVAVPVDLRHTFIGDLVLTLVPPAATGVAPIVLHRRAGGATRDIKRTYDASSAPGLGALAGVNCRGTWTLRIEDKAARDDGTLLSFGLEIHLVHPDDRRPRPAPKAARAARRPRRRPAGRKRARR